MSENKSNNISINKRKELDQTLKNKGSSYNQLKKSKVESEFTNISQSVFEQAMEFVRAGDHDAILQYLNSGVVNSINTVNQDNDTLLMQACKEGSIDSVLFLLDLGADINLRCSGDFAALNMACLYGYMGILKLLLSRGAAVNNISDFSGSALISACEGGNVDLVKHLLDLGADVNAVGGKLGTALRSACYNGSIEIVELLLAHGASVDLTDSSGATALMEACRAKKIHIVALLLQNKADVDRMDSKGRSATIITCEAAAAEVSEQQHSGVNSISSKDYADIVRLIGRRDATLVDATDGKGDTALIILCRQGAGAVDIVKVLIGLHVDVNKADYRGRTPLMLACAGDLLPLVEVLLDAGATVNAIDDLNRTALFHACSAPVLKLLLSRALVINFVSKYRGSALLAASVEQKWDLVELFLQRGAELCGDGVSFISQACEAGQFKVVDILLDREVVGPLNGADIARLAEDQTTYPELAKLKASTTAIDIRATADGSKLTYREICARIKSGEIESFRGASRDAFLEAGSFRCRYYSMFLTACKKDNRGLVELLLDCSDGISLFTALRAKILVDACVSRRLDVAKHMLECGTNVNITDDNGLTALVAACYPTHTLRTNGHTSYTSPESTSTATTAISLVKLLLYHGADPNLSTKHYTPLVGAVLADDLDMLKLLLYEGADGKALVASGDSATLVACRDGKLAALELLCLHGADMRAEEGECMKAACKAGHSDIVQWLLDHGTSAEVEVGGKCKKETPLSIACAHHHYNISQQLLERGATVHIDLIPSLCEASGGLDILQLLVAYGADVNAMSNDRHRSALLIACASARSEVVEWLLENGADITRVGGDGMDALDLVTEAFFNGHSRAPEVVQALLEHGAGLNAYTNAIFDRASAGGCDGILKVLLARRVPGGEARSLSRALYDACGRRSVEMMRLLLQHGATIAEADEGRWSTCLI